MFPVAIGRTGTYSICILSYCSYTNIKILFSSYKGCYKHVIN